MMLAIDFNNEKEVCRSKVEGATMKNKNENPKSEVLHKDQNDFWKQILKQC